MADPTKFQILKVLSNCREICVSDLSLILNLPHSAISHALKDLRNIGLVEVKKCKKLGCYALTQSKEMKKIQNLLRVIVKEVNLDG